MQKHTRENPGPLAAYHPLMDRSGSRLYPNQSYTRWANAQCGFALLRSEASAVLIAWRRTPAFGSIVTVLRQAAGTPGKHRGRFSVFSWFRGKLPYLPKADP